MEKKTKIIIGVLIAIVIFILVVEVIDVWMMGETPDTDGVHPIFSMIANPVNHSCTITVANPTSSSLRWSTVWYTLTDITNSKDIDNSTTAGTSNATIILPRAGQVQVGQIITISPVGAWAQGNPLDNKTQYRFTIVFNVTGETIGSVSWTQP